MCSCFVLKLEIQAGLSPAKLELLLCEVQVTRINFKRVFNVCKCLKEFCFKTSLPAELKDEGNGQASNQLMDVYMYET